MIYNILGKKDIKASRIGFGCWQLGGNLTIGKNPHGYGKIDEKEATKAIDYAIDYGINFFDTADTYGLGKSESLLGKALKGKRNKIIICTKGGKISDGVSNFILNSSHAHIISACNDSLKRLDTDYIDIYLLHFIPPKEQIEQSLDVLKTLQKNGKIKDYGISVANGVNKIPELMKNFPIIEGYYNLLLRDFEKYDSSETSFIAASPLSRGLLGGKKYISNLDEGDVRKKWAKGEVQHDWYIKQQVKIDKFKRLASEWNIPLKILAIAYILSNNIVAIPGIKTKTQIYELLESLKHVPLNKDKLQKIKEI
jgi:aryl-alcohol dehydrogenase-like predicted oxidoreductase|tara:strand:+ start:360 stop:1289 length:930 start_codon:yes stop_codon:yes gene_type:complete